MILSPGSGSLIVSWLDLGAEIGSHDVYLERLTERCAVHGARRSSKMFVQAAMGAWRDWNGQG
jgi:hypothetical protein